MSENIFHWLQEGLDWLMEKERGNKQDQVSSESSILLGPEVLDLNYIIPIS